MKRKLQVILAISALLSAVGAASVYLRRSSPSAQSPYTDQLSSSIRGLSSQEVDDLINGRGAGYARAAELNSYPGPLHVLELAPQLNLPDAQVQQIETVFQQMNAKAKSIGEAIVEQERELNTAFASGSITSAELRSQTDSLAVLYGELRAVHLEAHLEITPMLRPDQITAYNALRGYIGSETTNQHGHHHKH